MWNYFLFLMMLTFLEKAMSCPRDYVKVGCYNTYALHPIMSKMLVNDRYKTSHAYQGHDIDWNQLPESIRSLACRCSKKAKEYNFKYFSIRHYGICYGGNNKKEFDDLKNSGERHKSTDCINPDYSTCKFTLSSECVGTDWSDFLFEIVDTPPISIKHSCRKKYNKVGCFKRHLARRILNTLLIDSTSKSSHAYRGFDLDWNNFEDSIYKLACRCEREARKGGFEYFGIRFYGRCYGGRDITGFTELIQDSHSRSTHCVNSEYLKCYDKEYGECVGEEWSDYIYELKTGDAGSAWSEWKTCSAACGHGTQMRTRTCGSPNVKDSSKSCLHSIEEKRNCTLKPCPVDGGFSEWSEFSNCSKLCGGGTQTRRRTCDHPKPANGGKQCSGPTQQSKQCNAHSCKVDGGFSEWSEYTNCTKPCGRGTKGRYRTCTNPKPANQGKDCTGRTYETKLCNTHSCSINTETFRVCENKKSVLLKCSTNKIIHILRASFGRKSNQFCGSGSQPELSCPPTSVTSKVKSLCHGESSCFLQASSGIFGNPCANVMKYLEVRYRCIYAASQTIRVCEGKPQRKIGCAKGKALQLVNANFGRSNLYSCGHPTDRSATYCRSENSYTIVAKNCQDKKSCFLSASNDIFGYSCNNTLKYLEVQYRCFPRPIFESVLCQYDDSKELRCSASFTIHIREAKFGRLSPSYCRQERKFESSACSARGALSKVKSDCQGKEKCTIKASAEIFGDPCPSISKYLEVRYQCIPG